jgi:hypothetical protein
MSIESMEMLRLALMDKTKKRRYHLEVSMASVYEAIDDAEWAQVPEAEKTAVSELLTMQFMEVSKRGRAVRVLMTAFPETTVTWGRIFDVVTEPISMLEEANLPEPTLHQLEVARTIPWPIRN